MKNLISTRAFDFRNVILLRNKQTV